MKASDAASIGIDKTVGTLHRWLFKTKNPSIWRHLTEKARRRTRIEMEATSRTSDPYQ